MHRSFLFHTSFIIPRTALLSSIQPEAKLKPLTSQPTHFREIFKKSFYHVNTNKGSVFKQSGTDVVVLISFGDFLFYVFE